MCWHASFLIEQNGLTLLSITGIGGEDLSNQVLEENKYSEEYHAYEN